MNKPLVSIIVPVYNTEPYLRKCLDSILSQTLTNFEVVLVDDGSTDQSGRICDEYAGDDNRLHVIHKKNGGISSTLQECLKHVQGDYIIRVDSDDWIEPQMLKELYEQTIDGTEIVVADYYYDSTEQLYKRQTDVQDASSLLKVILEGKSMGSLCNKLIKRDLYEGIVFPLDLFYCEDVYILAQMLVNSFVSIKNYHSAFYHYVQHKTSITHTLSRTACENRWLFNEKIAGLLDRNQCDYIDILKIRKQKVLFVMIRSKEFSIKEILRYRREIGSLQNDNSLYLNDYKKNIILFYYHLIAYRIPFVSPFLNGIFQACVNFRRTKS